MPFIRLRKFLSIPRLPRVFLMNGCWILSNTDSVFDMIIWLFFIFSFLIWYFMELYWVSLAAQRLKRLPEMWDTWVQSLGREDPLEKEMATHSSTLAWRIPWTVEPGGLQSTWSQSRTWLHFHFSLSNINIYARSSTYIVLEDSRINKRRLYQNVK